MSRILILPSGNTFTHILEGKSIGCELEALGHEVLYGISKHYTTWAEKQKIRHYVLPDLWEKGPTDYPNVSWFIDHDYISKCVQAEIDLIKNLKPDYVLANFKYTSKISTGATDTRLIAMNILSMLPETQQNFGYLPEDSSPESRKQQSQLNFFYKFACFALNSVAIQFGLKPLENMSDYLDGDWVIIPDSPFFHRIKVSSLPRHYLPINFLQRKKSPPELQALLTWAEKKKSNNTGYAVADRHISLDFQKKQSKKKSVFLAFGSICRSEELLVYLISALGEGPWKLYVSTSGTNTQLLDKLKRSFPNVIFASFFDIRQLAQRGLDLYVCHGGLGSIYDGLQYTIPTLIIPQQPEQDHNGMLVEQLGIGARLWPSSPFSGKKDLYKEKILKTAKVTIKETVERILEDPTFVNNLNKAKNEMLKEVFSFKNPVDILQNIFKSDTVTACVNADIMGRS